MTRVIVHAGFHKTGTTSLQHFLAKNRNVLAPYFTYYGKAEFMQAGANARIYAQRPFIWRRLAFRRSFRRFLLGIPNAPIIVLSRETFSGVMPGHRNITGRTITTQAATATILAREIISALRVRFGPDVRVEFLYTTRDRESWIRSVYGHLLRSIHLTIDYPAFYESFAKLSGPEHDAHHIADEIAPVPVHIADLAEFANHPEGPAAAVLEIAGVPDQVRLQLKPAKLQNPGQSGEMELEFLHLNRSGQTKKNLKIIKEQMQRGLNEGSGQ